MLLDFDECLSLCYLCQEFHAKASIEVENEKIESHGTGPNKSAARKSAEASLVSKLKNEITERSNRSNVKDAKISSKKDVKYMQKKLDFKK